MAADDFDVICYKVLAYLYRCIKEGVRPSEAGAQEIAGVNPVYWEAVMGDLVDHGFVSAAVVRTMGGTEYGAVRITSEGVAHLEESRPMARARAFLGGAFEAALKVAVEASRAL
ncbi:MAG: hypothetical protein Q4B35_06500 [Slackia sp.]|nr:hypothetical protein [Slackia sp.]